MIRGALIRDQMVYLDIQPQEELILLDDLLELGLIDAQLLHLLVLQRFLLFIDVLVCKLILHTLVVFLVNNQLDYRLVGYRVLLLVVADYRVGLI